MVHFDVIWNVYGKAFWDGLKGVVAMGSNASRRVLGNS